MTINKDQGCTFAKPTFINIGKMETMGLSFATASRVVSRDLLYFDHVFSVERFQKLGEGYALVEREKSRFSVEYQPYLD